MTPMFLLLRQNCLHYNKNQTQNFFFNDVVCRHVCAQKILYPKTNEPIFLKLYIGTHKQFVLISRFEYILAHILLFKPTVYPEP